MAVRRLRGWCVVSGGRLGRRCAVVTTLWCALWGTAVMSLLRGRGAIVALLRRRVVALLRRILALGRSAIRLWRGLLIALGRATGRPLLCISSVRRFCLG
jgi:hypothetical protein